MKTRVAILACVASLAWAGGIGGIKDAVKRNLDKGREHLQEVDDAAEETKADPNLKPLPEDPRELVKLLGVPSLERRDAAQKKLEALGEKAEPALLEGQASKEAEIRERVARLLGLLDRKRAAVVQTALDERLKDLKLVLEGPAGPCAPGKPVALKARLRNDGKDPLSVALCGVDAGPGRAGALVSLEFRSPSAPPVVFVQRTVGPSSAATNPVTVELKPGEERDVFTLPDGTSVIPMPVPGVPGRHSAVLRYRLSGPGLPCGEVRSEPVDIEVPK